MNCLYKLKEAMPSMETRQPMLEMEDGVNEPVLRRTLLCVSEVIKPALMPGFL
jgi:hypothetical protein